ncbi:hypothetical protein [Yinghuangia sp. YIM S09857]|uniref:hypothetical protein n=1 Tax=Yinghuangia sp. YIM S09857 TaxID=3436929 RepID=UPI003F53365C
MRALAGVAVACVLVLSACGEDDGSDKTAPPPTSSGAPVPTTASSASSPTESPSAPASSSTATGGQPSATSAKPSAPQSSAPAEKPGAAPKTKEGAIQRYEAFLHAVGREDLDTICDVAGPAAKKAENDGFGPCRSTFPITFQMIPDSEQAAMRTATVDPGGVTQQSATKVVIPLSAVKASAPLSEEGMGDSAVMEYINGNWYVTD